MSDEEYLELKKKYNRKRIPYPCHRCRGCLGKILISLGYVFYDHDGRKQCIICRIEDLEKIFMIDQKHPTKVKLREN